MSLITAIWRTLAGRSGPALKQRHAVINVGQEKVPPDLRAPDALVPRPLRSPLAARRDVEGLLPHPTGRLIARPRVRWQAQEPETPAWDNVRAPEVPAHWLTDARAIGEERAS
jgi:hypothetical protein